MSCIRLSMVSEGLGRWSTVLPPIMSWIRCIISRERWRHCIKLLQCRGRVVRHVWSLNRTSTQYFTFNQEIRMSYVFDNLPFLVRDIRAETVISWLKCFFKSVKRKHKLHEDGSYLSSTIDQRIMIRAIIEIMGIVRVVVVVCFRDFIPLAVGFHVGHFALLEEVEWRGKEHSIASSFRLCCFILLPDPHTPVKRSRKQTDSFWPLKAPDGPPLLTRSYRQVCNIVPGRYGRNSSVNLHRRLHLPHFRHSPIPRNAKGKQPRFNVANDSLIFMWMPATEAKAAQE